MAEMTPPNARELAIKILREHIPIEPNEVCDKEINRVASLLREAMKNVSENARIEESSSWALASEKSQRELKEKLDTAVSEIKKARVKALHEAVKLINEWGLSVHSPVDSNTDRDVEEMWQNCKDNLAEAICALIPNHPKKEQETENK